MEKLQLQNKSVLITGADSGIGKAIALLFAKEGADIAFIHYHDAKDAMKTVEELKKNRKKSRFV
ncbi:SDR family NAD(P)-dependent oxidoreductase [Chryseobacterium sp.]|uniref:SDR family NAD(P)-dependent oxidoreductase n=1 Tax=Chryseobacterium sp. TaxID=1871047 RepID=UPI0031D3FBEE